jgi:CP family cyanate transporter-like MFS transporter
MVRTRPSFQVVDRSPGDFAAYNHPGHHGAVTTTAPVRDTRFEKVLVVVGIVVLGFNLRPAAVSVGPVLDELTGTLGMSGTVAGVLTMLPVLAFAAFGAVAPALARSFGTHKVTLVALTATVLGLAGRSFTGSIAVFLLLSLLALAGMAAANVLLPSLVKLHFPSRVGRLTAVYTTAMAVGLTAASVFTVPIAHHFAGGEGWRWGLFTWAVTALVAALPWLALVRHDRTPQDVPHTIGLHDVARTRLGWALAAFFGLQSMQAYSVFGWFAQVYRDAGFSAATAGILLGVITAMSIPLSLWVPAKAARMENQRWLVVGLICCYPVGYLGLIFAPVAGAWVWAVFVGAAAAVFPLVLTLIGLRARTGAGTAALSGFAQSVGYLMAALGPLFVGVLYDLTGGWTAPLTLLLALVVPQLVAGLIVSRPSYIEDHLGRRASRS